MTSIRETLRRMFNPGPPIVAGMYTYNSPADEANPYRLHLRVEQNGEGVLIINAATVLHLNQTATEFAFHQMRQTPREEVKKDIAIRFKVSPEKAGEDFDEFSETIKTLIATQDIDPVMYLDMERVAPFQGTSAPYRLDCALTYRLPGDSPASDAPMERVTRELNTEEWKFVLNKAWDKGIPHVVFTGGEPTLRPDLVDIILEAERLGMVTGLVSDGLRLQDEEFMNQLLLAGLDHLMVVLNPDSKDSWKVLEKVLPVDLFTAVHLTITRENVEKVQGYLAELAKLKPNAVSLSAGDKSLMQALEKAREQLANEQINLVWEVAVPYMHLNPVTQEVGENKVISGAGKAWLYVEPDGDVLPDQNINQTLGNILNSSWEQLLSWQGY